MTPIPPLTRDRTPARRITILLVAGLTALGAAACGDATDPTGPPPTTVARFRPSPTSETTAWGDVPFPSELYRNESGEIRIGALPTTLSDSPLFTAIRDLLAARDGFCATCNSYFVIDGDLDGAHLAPGALDVAEPRPSDPVILADVDPASPERGRLFALRTEWNDHLHAIAVRPARGIALHRSRRYAAVLTSALRAVDGSPLGPDATFRAARGARGAASSDPVVARTAAAIHPALDELERIGVDRRDVVALANFTTEDVPALALEVRAALQDGPPLAVTIERRRRGSEIDDLLGVPSEDRPGIDVPPAPGSAGSRSIGHAHIAEVITGAFSAPRIVTGTGTEIGVLRRGADGQVLPGPRETVPFVLTIPAGVDRRALPTMVAHHGFNASRVTGFASAETAARVGVAVLAIDGFQHGWRAASARDEVNAMRGDLPGADGFAETQPLDVSGRVFGLIGAAPGLEIFPGYPLATLLQLSADVASAARVLSEVELARALTIADGGTSTGSPGPIGFDPRRIGFLGNSLGAVVGSAALVAEPTLRAGIQNVPPGSIIETLAESPEFRPLVEAIFLPRLGISGPFDEVNRHLVLDPIVDLSRWILEPADPLALAPYLERDPVRAGGAPALLLQVASLDEVAAALATASMVEATGVASVTRYDPAAHGMLEVQDQSSRYEPPAAPPFRERPSPLAVVNPLAAEHAEIAEFLTRELASPAISATRRLGR